MQFCIRNKVAGAVATATCKIYIVATATAIKGGWMKIVKQKNNWVFLISWKNRKRRAVLQLLQQPGVFLKGRRWKTAYSITKLHTFFHPEGWPHTSEQE